MDAASAARASLRNFSGVRINGPFEGRFECHSNSPYYVPPRWLDAVDGGDVRMVQRRKLSRFASESRGRVGIVRDCFGKKFDCGTAAELRIRGLIELAHFPRAQVGT